MDEGRSCGIGWITKWCENRWRRTRFLQLFAKYLLEFKFTLVVCCDSLIAKITNHAKVPLYCLVSGKTAGLEILEAKREHAGVWICEASNAAGKAEYEISLDVWSEYLLCFLLENFRKPCIIVRAVIRNLFFITLRLQLPLLCRYSQKTMCDQLVLRSQWFVLLLVILSQHWHGAGMDIHYSLLLTVNKWHWSFFVIWKI